MHLSQLVEINQKGIVANSVNFDMLDQPEMNLHLCEGFIFNYDPKKPELSTVGILDALRRSYHSRNEPNIHLMIQQYGKGKSHFAVAIANFFKQSFDSPEVQGILHQVEMATGKNKAIAEGLKLFKQNQQHKHLVICLSGDKGGDIRKQFLQVLDRSLKEQGIADSLAQHVCTQPLRYLESLDAQQRVKAEEYLQSIGNPDGDLNCLIGLLKENNPAVIPTVKNLALHLTNFIPDFSTHIDIEAILQDLLKNYCTGENAQFQGILILFDELNYYLQSWAADQIGAGGTALQNITNICENYKGKIALLSFTQIEPARALGISATVKESYLKISSRLAPKDSTYNPASSLELVLDNLLIQNESHPNWAAFYSRWNDTLLAEAGTAYGQRIKIYKEKGWTSEQFYRHLGKGCFPLHPLTAYLLCNLDFTQDRTAIQFIKSYVKNFIQDQPIEKAGKLNYIYPIALVDTFIENFSNYSVYTHYKKALNLVAGSDEPDEATVLKALFLFYTSGEKLTKPDREEHQEILASLTGLSKPKLKEVLKKLEETRDIIYYKPETKLYRFWEGDTPKSIEEEIEDKIKDTPTSVDGVVAYCRSHIKTYLGKETIIATQFVKENKLIGEDWQFEYKIYSIDGCIRALESEQTLKFTKERGILAYVLAETQEELQEFRRTIDNYLSKSPIKNQIAVAIPSEETGLARVLLKIKILEEKDAAEKQLFGAAYKQLLQRWQSQVDTELERLLKYCTYHCVGLDKIPSIEQSKPQRIISALLQQEYSMVPPVDEIDIMRSNHTTGTKIVGFVAKQLFADNLTPQNLPPEASYGRVIDTIFVSRWGLLKKASQKYIVQEPTNEKIRHAWDLISQVTTLGELPDKSVNLEAIWKILSAPPYGYSEYNFTILLAAWLAYHRKEVYLHGAIKLSAKRGELVTKQSQSLKDWANSDILQKPISFVSDWIVKGKSKLIRYQKPEMPALPRSPIAYDAAQQYLEAVAAFLESNELEPVEVGKVTKNTDRVSVGVEQINNWFQPAIEVEALSDRTNLETLLQLYLQLLQHPPALDLRSDAISVIPTQQQRDRFSQALQTVSQKIAELVAAQSKRSESLLTEEACNAYKLEIQGLIDKITPIKNPYLDDLITSLQNAIRAAELKLTQIREQAKVRECLSQIQNLSTRLNDSSTQQDYTNTRSEIAILARSIPDNKPEAVEVQQILQSIDRCYKELTQSIEIWEERSSGVTSRKQIVDLFEEISRQDRRFTEEASKQKINALQEQLKQELLKIESKSAPENLEVKRQLQLQLEAEQKLAEERRIMQEIRKFNTTKINTIQLCEEAIQEIETLAKKLNAPAFEDEINQILRFIRDKITGYHQSVMAVRTRLSTVNNLTDLSHISTEYAKLDFVFQDSADYPTYQELQQQIQHLRDDLEQIQNLETRYQQSDSIASCNHILEMIGNEQLILHDLDRFREKISQLEENLHKKIQDYTAQLREYQHNLEYVTTAREAQRLQEELLKKSSQYSNSDVEEQYEAIRSELKMLIELLQLAESTKVNTLESCQAQLDKLRQWENTAEVTPSLRDRLDSLYTKLEETKLQLTQALQLAASEWLKELDNQYIQIERSPNDTDKLEIANDIIQQIQTQNQYIKLLNPQELESLEYIQRQCVEEQGKHKAAQILLLFQQLSRVQRQSLYEQLADYISDSTAG